ncbi:MAG: hypothetical protein PVH99_04695 [Desulfobacteraceae bacterium]|jgi:hypothetical protein
MIKYLRGHMSRPIVLWVVFLLLLFFLISKPAIGFSETLPKGFLRTAVVEVQGKTHHSILVGERHFLLTENTTFLDLNGQNMELDKLPVPCKADIKYLLRMDEDPLLLELVIKELYPDSLTVFAPRK